MFNTYEFKELYTTAKTRKNEQKKKKKKDQNTLSLTVSAVAMGRVLDRRS